MLLIGKLIYDDSNRDAESVSPSSGFIMGIPFNKIKSMIIFFILLFILPALASSEEIYQFERMWPTLQQPWFFICPNGLTMSADGYIYVADTLQVQKFTSDGQFITKWGREGSGDGEFNRPKGIATDINSNVYVIDSDNHRIQKFTSDGEFIVKFGEYGSDPALIREPYDVGACSNGKVYVVDLANNRIQVFREISYTTGISKAIIIAGGGSYTGNNLWDTTQMCANFTYRTLTFNNLQHAITEWAEDAKSLILYLVDHGNDNTFRLSSTEILSASDLDRWLDILQEKTGAKVALIYDACKSGSFLSTLTPPNGKDRIVVTSTSAGEYAHFITQGSISVGGDRYEALTFQGYTDDDIYFMSPITFSTGVDGLSTLLNLSYAIETWARQSIQDLVVYMVGNGDQGTFRINSSETLSASDLDSWLDSLQAVIPGKVMVIYDACRSGSFLSILTPPDDKERILFSSAGENQSAYFLSGGDLSFSNFFWRCVLNGMNVWEAFLHAKNAIAFSCRDQTPHLDDNGNGLGNEKADGKLCRYYTIGVGIMLAGDDPLIGSICPVQTLSGKISATIWVEDVTTTGTIERVFAVINPPQYVRDISGQPVTDLPTVKLVDKGNGRYEGTYNDFSIYGTYNIAVYAKDMEGNLSVPKETQVFRTDGPDIYEDDDTSDNSRVIMLNDAEAQAHNFHDAGDEDWVKFYGISDVIYTIKISNADPNCDAVIELYYADGNMLLPPNDDGGLGEDELLDWKCEQDGVYYVKIKNFNPSLFGEDTGYDLTLYHPIGELWGTITGNVKDTNTGEPIEGVLIQTDCKASAISLPNGAYFMVHPTGDFTITAEAFGYQPAEDSMQITEGGLTIMDFNLIGDADSCPDSDDLFPNDPNECLDTDNDGIGNNNDCPTVPEINVPLNNSETTFSLQPILSVINSKDNNGHTLYYFFEIYSNYSLTDEVSVSQEISEGENITEWRINKKLEENCFYYWRVRSYDKICYSNWMNTANFFVNTIPEPPSIPNINWPENKSQVENTQPTLKITNAEDKDLDPLIYEFELYADANQHTPVTSNLDISEGNDGNTTSWKIPISLKENTSYWWRVQAKDDDNLHSGWSNLFTFFVNTNNDDPNIPSICSPHNEGEVDTSASSLEIYNSSDADMDILTYFFEIDKKVTFISPSLKQSSEVIEDPNGVTVWNPLELDDNTIYYWRARAYDGKAYSKWCIGSFFVNLFNDAPSIPTINNPGDNSEVKTLRPLLIINPSIDMDYDQITYDFELYAESDLSIVVDSISGAGCSWSIEMNLTNNMNYYWRARAIDEHGLASQWSSAATFKVNSLETTLEIYVSQDVFASATNFQTVEVKASDCPIKGASIEIPPGALTDDVTITIGEATNTPPLPAGTRAIGRIIDFGPTGIAFIIPVSIKIPYTNEDLEKAGVNDPSKLEVFTYDMPTLSWELVDIDHIDIQNNLLICRVDHFSLYTVGISELMDDGDGCFIGTASYGADGTTDYF
ncbi:MAG: C13 family peptidase [bacterium]